MEVTSVPTADQQPKLVPTPVAHVPPGVVPPSLPGGPKRKPDGSANGDDDEHGKKKMPKKFTVEEKAEIVAKLLGTPAAGHKAIMKEYNLSNSTFYRWKKQLSDLQGETGVQIAPNEIKKLKVISQTAKRSPFEKLETELYDRICRYRSFDEEIDAELVLKEARTIAKDITQSPSHKYEKEIYHSFIQMSCYDREWLLGFAARSQLALRNSFGPAIMLKAGRDRVRKARESMRRAVEGLRLPSVRVLSAEHVVVNIDMPRISFIHEEDSTYVRVERSKTEKSECSLTALLTVNAKGEKLPLMVIMDESLEADFLQDEGHDRSKENNYGFSADEVRVLVRQRGQLDNAAMETYTEDILYGNLAATQGDEVFKMASAVDKQIMIWDCARQHISEKTKRKLEECGTIPFTIPTGTSPQLLPFGQEVRASFERELKKCFIEYIVRTISDLAEDDDDDEEVSAGQRDLQLEVPSAMVLVSWLKQAWHNLRSETIRVAFTNTVGRDGALRIYKDDEYRLRILSGEMPPFGFIDNQSMAANPDAVEAALVDVSRDFEIDFKESLAKVVEACQTGTLSKVSGIVEDAPKSSLGTGAMQLHDLGDRNEETEEDGYIKVKELTSVGFPAIENDPRFCSIGLSVPSGSRVHEQISEGLNQIGMMMLP